MYLIKTDISKNQIKTLPDYFGKLQNSLKVNNLSKFY